MLNAFWRQGHASFKSLWWRHGPVSETHSYWPIFTVGGTRLWQLSLAPSQSFSAGISPISLWQHWRLTHMAYAAGSTGSFGLILSSWSHFGTVETHIRCTCRWFHGFPQTVIVTLTSLLYFTQCESVFYACLSTYLWIKHYCTKGGLELLSPPPHFVFTAIGSPAHHQKQSFLNFSCIYRWPLIILLGLSFPITDL